MLQLSKKVKDYSIRYLQAGFPFVLSNLNTLFTSVIDNSMVGRIVIEGSANLARSTAGQVNAFSSTPHFFLLGFSSVLAPFIAGAKRTADYLEASKALKYIWITSSIFGFMLSMGFLYSMDYIDYIIPDGKAAALAKEGYFQYIFLAIFPTAMAQPVKRYLDGIGWRPLNTSIGVGQTLLKIGLNYAWIHGKWGFAQRGFAGAGLATLVSAILTLLVYVPVLYSLHRKGLFYFSPFYQQFDTSFCLSCVWLGLPAGLSLAARMVNFTILSRMAAALGTAAASARPICIDMLRFATLLTMSLHSAASILVGSLWKKKEVKEIQLVGNLGYVIGGSCLVVSALLGYFLFPYVLAYHNAADEVRAEVLGAAGITMLFSIADGLNFIGAGILRGMRDTSFPMLAGMMSYACISLPLSYFLTFYMQWRSLASLLGGNLAGTILLAALLFWRYRQKLESLKQEAAGTATVTGQ